MEQPVSVEFTRLWRSTLPWLFVASAFTTFAQDFRRQLTKGTWEYTIGLPAKSIPQADGSIHHVSALIFDVLVLDFKRNSRVFQHHASVEGPPIKGRWILKNDTLQVQFSSHKEVFWLDTKQPEHLVLRSIEYPRVIYGHYP